MLRASGSMAKTTEAIFVEPEFRARSNNVKITVVIGFQEC